MADSFMIISSRQCLAQELWLYGEDDLWDRARDLSLDTLTDIGVRAGGLYTPETEALWGSKISSGLALVMAAIETFEGVSRLPNRRRRRGRRGMPAQLVTDAQVWWNDMNAVSRILHARDLASAS
jgi:D-serine deaminase-like pyridoxal phosphate-dependent protein